MLNMECDALAVMKWGGRIYAIDIKSFEYEGLAMQKPTIVIRGIVVRDMQMASEEYKNCNDAQLVIEDNSIIIDEE